MSKSSDEPKLPVPFTPVELRRRRDGWTAERQVAFIEALAETACFEEACRRVGMSDTSAYRLCFRHPAFEKACDLAIDIGLRRADHAAVSRSVRGVARPIFYKGVQVGEWRHFDERLTMFLLRTRRPDRYGKWIERAPPPNPGAPNPGMKIFGEIDEFFDEDDQEDGGEEGLPEGEGSPKGSQ